MSKIIEWKGAREMQDSLMKLTPFLEKKILDQAARAGLSHFVKKVRPQIPTDNKDDVHLNKAIKIRKAKKTRDRVMFRVGIIGRGSPETQKDARKYAHIFEFGSKHVKGTHIFTNTFESELENMLDVVSIKIKRGLEKYGRSRNRSKK